MLKMRNIGIAVTGILFFWTSIAMAVDDSIANRTVAAERYAVATNFHKMFDDTASAISTTMTADQAEKFRKEISGIRKNFKRDAIDLMIRYFTADELHALADFYETPIGKSILNKFPEFMSGTQVIINRYGRELTAIK